LQAFFVAFALLSFGCHKSAEAPIPDAGAAQPSESISQTTDSGPVKATVSLSPKKPRLGDPLTLTLTVDAQHLVRVEMPPFGEALGRFSIVNFTPRSETAADGSTRYIQRYVLDAPMSGRQRIPSLRVEFTDGRPGQNADAGADKKDSDAPRELLTEELAIDIASVLPSGEVQNELKGLRGPLPLEVSIAQSRWLRFALPPLLLILGIGGWLMVRRLRQRARLRVRVSAYDAAMQRLGGLERRGWPKSDEADPWYVELSDIVRRYIEDRYGVRAPELTTEEFLREARQQLRMQPNHRELLEAFLSTCDRVKFAGYRPGESESRQALEEARRFLADTRVVPAQQAQP
jgi:hypothetical protein